MDGDGDHGRVPAGTGGEEMKHQRFTDEEKAAVVEAAAEILKTQLQPTLLSSMGHIENMIADAVKASDRVVLTELRAIRKLSMQPAMRDGKPAPVWDALDSLIEKLEEGL